MTEGTLTKEAIRDIINMSPYNGHLTTEPCYVVMCAPWVGSALRRWRNVKWKRDAYLRRRARRAQRGRR